MSNWEDDGMYTHAMLYWELDSEDDRGYETYLSPITIYGGYLDKIEEVIRKMEGSSKQVTSNSKITTGYKIKEDSYIAIGTLDDFEGIDLTDPRTLGTLANRVMVVHASPDIDTGEVDYLGFLR